MKNYLIALETQIVWRFDVEASSKKEAFTKAKELQLKAYQTADKIVHRIEGIGDCGERWYTIQSEDEDTYEKVSYNFDEEEVES